MAMIGRRDVLTAGVAGVASIVLGKSAEASSLPNKRTEAEKAAAKVLADSMTTGGVPQPVAANKDVIDAVLNLIQALVECLIDSSVSPKEAIAVSDDPGILWKIRLNRMIRRKLRKTKAEPYIDQIQKSVLVVGKKSTEAEMTKLFEEVE